MKKYLLVFLPLLCFCSGFCQDVVPDPSFGQNGLVTTASVSTFSCAAKQSDGKIVAAAANGHSDTSVNSFTVVRFNVDGTLDSSFGSNGKAKIAFDNIPYLFIEGQPNAFPGYADAYSIAVNKDGQIAVAGRVYYNRGWFTGFGFAVAIFNPDGSPVNGKSSVRPRLAVYNIGSSYVSDVRAASVAAQKDGKFVVTGERQLIDNNGGSIYGTVYNVVRYALNGAEEKVVETFIPSPSGSIHANSISVQGDSKILVIGEGYTPNVPFPVLGREFVRYNPDLTLDNSFNKTGLLYTSFLTSLSDHSSNLVSYSSDHSISVQDDGKILAVGQNNTGLAIARFLPNGTFDNAFGVGGIVSLGLPAATASVSVLDNSKIMVAGGYGSNLNLIRMDANGTLDASFGVGGKVTKAAGTGILNTLITQNRFYAIGGSQNKGAIADFMLNVECKTPTFLNNQSIVLDASCDFNDGNISIVPTSGIAPFQYSIDGGATYVDGPTSGYSFQNLAPGSYQLRLKDVGGCESALVTKEIKRVYGAPAFLNNNGVVLDASCAGHDGSISIIPTCGTSPYMYSIDGGATYVKGPDKGYTFMGLGAGNYQLRLIDGSGSESAVIIREVKANAYGNCSALPSASPMLGSTGENALTVVHIYPNPSKGQFKVHLQGFASAKVQVQILDAKGSVVQTKTLNASEANIFDINLQDKARGLYFVRVVSDKGVHVQKVTVQ